MTIRRAPFLVAAALLLAPAFAHAQSGDSSARNMIHQAMEDYQNLDIDGAVSRLRLALRGCQHGCSNTMLARIHVALGVVAVGGQNDSSTGTNEFVEALRLDPNAEPDAMLVTPEITAAFNQAHNRAGGGGGGGGGGGSTSRGGRGQTSETSGGGGGGTTETSGGGGGGGSGGGTARAGNGTLLHTPVPEQLVNTPVPVYVEAGAGANSATHYTVHFRGLGMSNYQDLAMDRVANGYGVEIPCGQVIRPNLDYYVTAADDRGNIVAQAGSAQSPTRVPIVATRSQPAPALPGRMPPDQCGEECPPGMACHGSHGGGGGGGGGGESSTARGSRQLGDPCENNNQCAEGMHCESGACASGEAAAASTPSEFYRFAADIGGGLGMAWLSGTPTYAEYRDWGGGTPTCGMPDASGNDTLVCPPIRDPGFAYAGILHIGIRFNILSRVGIGLFLRFQPNAASVGTLPNMFIGGRVYVALNPGGFVRRGVVFAPFIGTGVGQMQAEPLLAGSGKAAHVISGLNNLHLGAHAEYGFGVAHAAIDLAFNFQVPNFLFVIDAVVSVGVHF